MSVKIRYPIFERGSVWLCGAGPGDPGLITCLCRYALENADHIIYDALVNEDIFTYAAARTNFEFVGKRGGKKSILQTDITLRIIASARSGKRVLRLKGGDPFVFGRGADEAMALKRAGIRFRVVPGVTAGIGGLAYAGIPLTYRNVNHAVVLITGHDAKGDMPSIQNWQQIAGSNLPLVFYMAIKNIAQIQQVLLENGRSPDESCAIIRNASLPTQTVHQSSLAQLQETVIHNNIKPPAIIVIGEIVKLQHLLDWYETTQIQISADSLEK